MKNIKLLLLAAISIFVAACQTTVDDVGKKHSDLTPQAKQVLVNAAKVIGPAIVDTLFSVAQQELSGGKVTAPYIGFTISDSLWRNIGNVSDSADVSSIILNSANYQVPALAKSAATAFAKSSNSDPTAKANAIAAVISTAAGAPPPPSTVK